MAFPEIVVDVMDVAGISMAVELQVVEASGAVKVAFVLNVVDASWEVEELQLVGMVGAESIVIKVVLISL